MSISIWHIVILVGFVGLILCAANYAFPGLVLTKRAIWSWVVVLTFSSLIIGAISAPTVPYALGGFVAVSVFPLAWWGLHKFKAARAKKPLILWSILVCLFGISESRVQAQECSSDYDCGFREFCAKPPMSSDGHCLKKERGSSMSLPDPGSAYPNMNVAGECRTSAECPLGARCDKRTQRCVER